MSLFGEETIPVTEAPEMGYAEEAAVETEVEEVTEELTEDVEEETVSEEEHTEELLAGKYRSVEDLVKGYQNAQRKITELAQPKQTQQPQVDTEDYNERVLRSFEQDPAGTISYLVNQQLNSALAPMQQERQMESLTKNFDVVSKDYAQLHTDEGVNQLFTKVNELAQDFGNPELIKNPSQRLLKMAAAELWGGESKSKVFNAALEQGRQEAENLRKQKLGVAVTTTKKQNEAPKTEAENIVDSIMAASKRGGLFG